MIRFCSIAVLVALLCTCYGVPLHIPGFNITDLRIEKQLQIFPQENPANIVDLAHSTRNDVASYSSNDEEAEFIVDKYEIGYARVVSTGITLTQGATGVLEFRMKFRGIDSKSISNADQTFSEALEKTGSPELVEKYKSLKDGFEGDLNIPWLSLLGYNILEQFNQEKAQQVAQSLETSNYNALSSEAEKILESYVTTNVEISGSLHATGVSPIPTKAIAFLRFARVEFGESQSTNVFSTNTDDLIAASPTGSKLPSDKKNINILPL